MKTLIKKLTTRDRKLGYIIILINLIVIISMSSCARASFAYNGGKLVKEPRLRPAHGYSIGLVFSIGLGEQYKVKR